MKTIEIVLIGGLVALAAVLGLSVVYSYPSMMGWPFTMWGMGANPMIGSGMMANNYMGRGMMNGMHGGMMGNGMMAGTMGCQMMNGMHHEYMEQHMANMNQMQGECMEMMHEHMGESAESHDTT